MFKNYADVDSPLTQESWREMSDSERLVLINQKISENDKFSVISATHSNVNGQVFVNLCEEIPSSERGTLLLSFESLLKESVDRGINVWHEPINDKNRLRQFRGIEVKS